MKILDNENTANSVIIATTLNLQIILEMSNMRSGQNLQKITW